MKEIILKKIDKKNFIETTIKIIATIITVAFVYIFREDNFWGNDKFVFSDVLYKYILICFNILVYFAYDTFFEIIKRIRSKDKKIKIFFIHFAIYMFLLSILYLLIYPGYWVHDELTMLNLLEDYKIDTWHSHLTQVYYAMTLLIFGNPKFIIIVQMLVISMIIAYIQTNITCKYKKKIYNVMMYLAFLLPPIYLHNLCAMRLVPYTYILLLFFSIIIFDKQNNVKLTCKKTIKLLILSLIMILWRSEGIIFIIINPILMYITYINRKKKWILILVLFFIISNKLYNYSIKQYTSEDYNILITVNPMSMMLNDENFKISEEDYNNINKVMDLEILKKYPNIYWAQAYFEADLVKEDCEQYLGDFWISYLKVVIENLEIFLKYRADAYSVGAGTYRLDKTIDYHAFSWYFKDGRVQVQGLPDFCEKHNIKAIDGDVKFIVETFLMGQFYSYDLDFQIIRWTLWNPTYVLIILILLMIYHLKKKDWVKSIIDFCLICFFGIVFLTEPGGTFRYFLPVYLIGINMIVLTTIEFINRKVKNNIK